MNSQDILNPNVLSYRKLINKNLAGGRDGEKVKLNLLTTDTKLVWNTWIFYSLLY